MAGPALIPDIAPPRADKAAPRNAAKPSAGSEDKPFDRVQKEVAGATRPAADKNQAAAGAKPEKQQAAEKGQADKLAHKEVASDDPAKSGNQPDLPPQAEPSAAVETAQPSETVPEEMLMPEDDAFALALPVGEASVRGNTLPAAALKMGAGPGPASNGATAAALLAGSTEGAGGRQLFMQMLQGGKAGAEGDGAGEGAMDLQSFKSSLAEALEGKGSKPADAPPPTMVSSPRGLELREGSALVRQYSTTVDTPVQQGDWGDKMAGKISWLANQRISFAEIHLNPADLGPIEVRVNVQNDQATVAVHAQNASVRDLLELNGQRLRDMMQDNGLNLTKMDVSDQPPRQQQQTAGGEGGQGGTGQRGNGEGEASGLVSQDGEAVSTGEVHLQWRSQVDTYA